METVKHKLSNNGHRDNEVNRDRDDRKNDGVGLEIERYREKEIETESLRECIREKK